MAKECAFCPATADITGEHIWSDWMNELFPGMTQVTFRKMEWDGTVLKKYPSPKLNMKTEVVCGSCNNGWMSRLEKYHAKPAMVDLIQGKSLETVGKKRAHGLALFAFKTAVIANRSLPESEFFFDEPERYSFHKSLTIPRDVVMFLVGMVPVSGGGIGSFNVHYPPHLSLNVCSFWIGQLGFQVISARSSTASKVESLPTPPGLTTRFYPVLEPNGRWPRSKVLSVEEFNDFSNRWNSIRRG